MSIPYPCYQIDVQNVPTGKLLAPTKRRVQWKFGFSNREAIAAGLCGIEARGKEHEVTMIWSLLTGKRSVYADGQEVHFSQGNRSETSFETSWTMTGGHTIKVIAHALPPVTYIPGFRQYDLQLDGCSIYDMPKIYELGSERSYRLVQGPQARRPPALPPSERPDAVPAEDRRSPVPRSRSGVSGDAREKSKPVSVPTESPPAMDLLDGPIDLMDQEPVIHASGVEPFPAWAMPPQPPQVSYEATYPQTLSSYTSPPPVVPPGPVLALANEAYTYGAPWQAPETTHPPPATRAAPSAVPAQPYVYAPPTRMGAPAAPMGYQPQPPPQPTVVSPPESPAATHAPVVPANALSMAPLSLELLEGDEAPLTPLTPLDRAMKNLVNLDDITETKAAPAEVAARARKEAETHQHRSAPLPPRTGYLGSRATLAEIQARVGARSAPSREVMRAHAFHPTVAQAGTMVLYGAPAAPVPGLPPPAGFGAGTVLDPQGWGQPPSHYHYGAPRPMYAAY